MARLLTAERHALRKIISVPYRTCFGFAEAPQLLQGPYFVLVSYKNRILIKWPWRQISTFTPLIFSAILYASNGEVKISYIDSLYNSVSAMTVTGLTTVNLSSLTHWQQTILFLQMCLGSPVSSTPYTFGWRTVDWDICKVLISWVMVFIRRSSFLRFLSHHITSLISPPTADIFSPKNFSIFSTPPLQRKLQISPFDLQKITGGLGSNV